MKHLLILISILLLSSPVFGDNHKGETLYGWGEYPDYVWKGFGEKGTHSLYKGEVENGVPNGQGTLTAPDGRKYVGDFKDGLPYGQGTFTFLDGWRYEGGWVFGKYHGQGTWTSPSGYQYDGEWKDGKRSGQGTQTYPNGGKYEGSWKKGVRWEEGEDLGGKKREERICRRYLRGVGGEEEKEEGILCFFSGFAGP